MVTTNQTNEKLLLVAKQMENGYQQPNIIKKWLLIVKKMKNSYQYLERMKYGYK